MLHKGNFHGRKCLTTAATARCQSRSTSIPGHYHLSLPGLQKGRRNTAWAHKVCVFFFSFPFITISSDWAARGEPPLRGITWPRWTWEVPPCHLTSIRRSEEGGPTSLRYVVSMRDQGRGFALVPFSARRGRVCPSLLREFSFLTWRGRFPPFLVTKKVRSFFNLY